MIDSKKPITGIKNHIINLWTQTIGTLIPNHYPISFLEAKKTKRLPLAPLRVLELQSHLLDALQTLLTLTQKSVPNKEAPSHKKEQSVPQEIPFHFSRVLTTDSWGFGIYWPYIQCVCQNPQTLYKEIAERRTIIGEIRGQFDTLSPPAAIQEALRLGNITLNPVGISGSYILYDKLQIARYLIKPFDEDIGAINNPKGFASPFLESPLLEDMPLYQSCFREVATYQIAEHLRIASIVPCTQLAIIQSDEFFDLSQQVSPREIQTFFEQVGYHVIKEKLCSVQEFVLESKTLFEALQELQTTGLLDEEIEALFDQKDFEEANLLLWITGDSDGHANNFLVFPKRTDEIGNQILGLKKIDNAFAFPLVNTQPYNYLSHLPNAKRPLSSSTRAKILQINQTVLSEILSKQGLQNTTVAMRQRIDALQKIVKNNPSCTIQTIQNQLRELL